MSFSSLGLRAELLSAITTQGYTTPTPIQSQAIPVIFEGCDLLAGAQTGTGKTAAFALPIVQMLSETTTYKKRRHPRALVLVPTRELAAQVSEQMQNYGRRLSLRSIKIYGGVNIRPQMERLDRGVDIVVATPGRLLDHAERGTIKLNEIEFLVLDEADRMLSMGFLPDMKAVRSYLPRGAKVHTYMFSATFPPDILNLAWSFMKDPRLLSLSRDHVHVTDNSHQYYVVPHVKRGATLAAIADYENPSSAIVFCNRKDDVAYVSVVLAKYGFIVDQISSDLSQIAREKVMNKLRKGEISMLVATDVAARGIDIPELSHVFQYGAPEDPESYIHRSGRTGRAGASGTAITVISDAEILSLNKISKKYEINFEECTLPSSEQLSAVMGERVVAKLEARFRDLTRHEMDNVERLYPFMRELSESEEGLRLLAMALNESYQKAFRGGEPKNVVTKAAPMKQGFGGRGGPRRGSRDGDRHGSRDGGRGGRGGERRGRESGDRRPPRNSGPRGGRSGGRSGS